MEYVTIEEAAKRGGGEAFFEKVRGRVIPMLVERGLLTGGTKDGKPAVADDAALARVMGLGIEGFVYNQQGWSFVAVRAPVEAVSAALGRRPGVVGRTERATPLSMAEEAGIEAAEEKRDAFLVKMTNSDWSVLILTVHWFKSCDAVMAAALAGALSKELETTALAAWDDDFSGSSMIVCDRGERTRTVSDEVDGWEAMYAYFYEQGIYLPSCFIASAGGRASLHVATPAEVERADHVLLAVPEELRSGAPHVFEKMGMMAAAAAAEIEDEEAFMAQMNDGVWGRAEAVLKGGKF